jgi:hypothetical protein
MGKIYNTAGKIMNKGQKKKKKYFAREAKKWLYAQGEIGKEYYDEAVNQEGTKYFGDTAKTMNEVKRDYKLWVKYQ